MTIRITVEGGAAGLSASKYAGLVALLVGFANAVDVEVIKTGAHSLIIRTHEAGAAVITSLYNFNETPPDDAFVALYTQTTEAGAGIPKVACRVITPEDALRVLIVQTDAHREHRRPITDTGMGEAEATTQIVGALLFSAATFAFVVASSAPGQFTVEETRRGLNPVEKGRIVKKRRSGEEERTVDKARGR